MITSTDIGELAAALAKAQAEIQGAKKDSDNPFFKSRYADLASVWDACRVPLTKHGIAVVQSPSTEGARVTVDTMLLHSSGQWIRGSMSCTGKDDSPQSVGSCTSYLKRYALQSFAGVAPEDDDAEAAQPRSGQEKQAARPQAASSAHFVTGEVGPVVVEKVGAGKAGAKAEVTFTNGDSLLTWNERVKATAESAVKSGKAVTIVIGKSASGNRFLASITLSTHNGAELAPAKQHEAPIMASEVPF